MTHDPEGYWEAIDARTTYLLPRDLGAPCDTVANFRGLREKNGESWICPRVELRFENLEAQQVVRALINQDTRELAGRVFDRAVADLPMEEQERILNRVLNTMNHADIVEILHPKPKPHAPPPTRRR